MSMRRLFVVVGACAILAAPLAAQDIPARVHEFAWQTQLIDLAAMHGIGVQAVRRDPQQNLIAIDGLSFQARDLTLHIGHLTLHPSAATGVLAAWPFIQTVADTSAPSGTISADDVSIDTNSLHAAIKHIEFSGTRLNKADLVALFDVHSNVPAAERLAKISASHIAIPEVRLDVKPTAEAPSTDQDSAAALGEKITYRDISLDDVVQGRARKAAITATSAVIQSTDSGEMQIALGPAQFSNLDLVQLAALLSAPGTDVPDNTKTLCDTVAIEGVKVTVPDTKADMGMGAVSLTNVKVHATPPKSKAGDRSAKQPSGFAYAYDRFDVASLDFTDLRFNASSGSTVWQGRIGHGTLSQMIADKVSDAEFTDFSVTGEGGVVKIGRLGWHGPPAQASLSGDGAAAVEHQKIVGDTLEIDLAKMPAPAAAAPARFLLGHFELTSDNPAEGLPSEVRATFDHLSFDLAGVKDGDFAQIAALGYGKLDLSSQLQAHFDNDAHQFDLNALSFTGVDMGTVQLSGRFDQVTKGLFSGDQSDLEAAVVRVLLRRLEIKVENAGLFDRLVAAAAKRQGISDAEMRKQMTDAATSLVPTLLNHGRGADAVVVALTKFIANPRTLRLSVSSDDGISALDAFLTRDPAALMDRLRIEAVADQ